MSNDRPTGETMSLDEATVSLMRESASVVDTLECRSLCRREWGNQAR